MTLRAGAGSIVRFSVFELDLRSGELRKNGARVPLQGQPLEILKALLERPGDLITRDELRQRLWRDDTFVDFEDGMNAAIRRLRDALGDHAATPRFVETLPRRGYRFIAPLVGETSVPLEAGETVQRSSRGLVAGLSRISWTDAVPWLLLAIGLAWVETAGRAGRETPRQLPTVRFEIRTPPLALFGPSPSVALSPDGTYLAYIVSDSYLGQLYVRRLDSLESKAVSGADQAQGPFFSPDGQWLAFFTRGTLQKVSVSGGSLATVCTLPTTYTELIHGASWGDDGNIVFENGMKLWRVAENNGSPRRISTPNDISPLFPEVLPGSRAVLFTGSRMTAPEQSGIWAMSTQGGEPRLLAEGGWLARYVRSGYLIYSVNGSLNVAPMDLQSLTLTAPSVAVITDLLIDFSDPRAAPLTPIPHFAVSSTGTLAYVPGPTVPATLGTLVWVDRSGNEDPLPVSPRAYSWPRLSPGGSRLAVDVFDGNDAPGNVKIYDFARRSWTPFTSHPAQDSRPVWTPDGLKVAFRSYRDGTSQLFLQLADGTGEPTLLTNSPSPDRSPWSFTPDGKQLVFSELGEQGYDLQVLHVEARRINTLPRTRFFKGSPALSPNGHWIAYRSYESGRYEIYVRPFPEWDKGRFPISASGGLAPAWSADGRELFFLNLSGGMMVVPVQTSGDFTAGTPKLLFKGPYVPGPGRTRNYDVAPDGRFLMIKEVERQAEPPARDKVTVVVNWADEVSRSLAPKK